MTVVDARTHRVVRTIGTCPHENNDTANGERVSHASIGRVHTPTDRSCASATTPSRGERYFQIVCTDGLTVGSRWDMGEELAGARRRHRPQHPPHLALTLMR